MKKHIPLSLCLFVLIAVSCSSGTADRAKVQLNGVVYKFEVANTADQRAHGLMFRKKLDPNSGMIFVYSYADYRYFYMKNTLIPLDIAFVDSQFKILNIAKMEPLDETTVPSEGKAMYAIEANRGFFEKAGVKSGDSIEILSPLKYYP